MIAVKAVPIDSLKPADWNPRYIRDERFRQLVDSIREDPDFMWRRPVLATASGTIYAGNMRYHACRQLGWTEIPAIIDDIPEHIAKARAMRDNNQYGDWDFDRLDDLLMELQNNAIDIMSLGFENFEIDRILNKPSEGEPLPDAAKNPEKYWTEMPAYEHDNVEPIHKIVVSFYSEDAVREFSEKLGVTVTMKTRSIVYPPDIEYWHDKGVVEADA